MRIIQNCPKRKLKQHSYTNTKHFAYPQYPSFQFTGSTIRRPHIKSYSMVPNTTKGVIKNSKNTSPSFQKQLPVMHCRNNTLPISIIKTNPAQITITYRGSSNSPPVVIAATRNSTAQPHLCPRPQVSA